MLENFGVTEENWRDAANDRAALLHLRSSPTYIGRGDRRAGSRSGRRALRGKGPVAVRELARTYGVTDVDGTQPDCWRYLDEIQLPGRPATELGYR